MHNRQHKENERGVKLHGSKEISMRRLTKNAKQEKAAHVKNLLTSSYLFVSNMAKLLFDTK